MRDVDRAWLAGLFEGEGCIAFEGKNAVRLLLSMTDQDVILRLKALTGVGSIRCGMHPRGTKPHWTWAVSNAKDASGVLDAIQPFLGERRSERAREAQARMARIKPTRQPGATHCLQGHPISGDNLYVNPVTGYEVCRTCRRHANREYMRGYRCRKQKEGASQ